MNLDLPEIQSLDPEEVIRYKLAEARRQTTSALMVEDTSFVMHCFGQLPGPFIKWFLISCGGPPGLYQLAYDMMDFAAVATTVIGYSNHMGDLTYYRGDVPGKIVSPRGDNGFLWDTIFQPDGHTQTFAQMTMTQKNRISHRGIALDKMRKHFEINGML